MVEVLSRLYLGNCDSASNREALRAEGITHIVNCALELPCSFEEELTYLPLRLRDPDPGLRKCLARACAFIDRGRREGKVLVHCVAAVSRSPSVVLAYLCHVGMPLRSAARYLAGVMVTCPDDLFLRQLHEHLGEKWTRESLEELTLVLMGRSQD